MTPPRKCSGKETTPVYCRLVSFSTTRKADDEARLLLFWNVELFSSSSDILRVLVNFLVQQVHVDNM
jgi:hypothetical protein